MSTPNTYALGTDVVCRGLFKTSAGVAADPSVVKFSVKNPNGVITTYTYVTDVQVVKDSTGHYHVNVDANEAGTWYFRFFATGTGKAADESSFIVAPSQFG